MGPGKEEGQRTEVDVAPAGVTNRAKLRRGVFAREEAVRREGALVQAKLDGRVQRGPAIFLTGGISTHRPGCDAHPGRERAAPRRACRDVVRLTSTQRAGIRFRDALQQLLRRAVLRVVVRQRRRSAADEAEKQRYELHNDGLRVIYVRDRFLNVAGSCTKS
jgi:hypothetical protein